MLRFNWSKLDSLAAEAVRAVINDKLHVWCNEKFNSNDNRNVAESNNMNINTKKECTTYSSETSATLVKTQPSTATTIETPMEHYTSELSSVSHHPGSYAIKQPPLNCPNVKENRFVQHQQQQQQQQQQQVENFNSCETMAKNNGYHQHGNVNGSAYETVLESTISVNNNHNNVDNINGSSNNNNISYCTNKIHSHTIDTSSRSATPLMHKLPCSLEHMNEKQENLEEQQEQRYKNKSYNVKGTTEQELRKDKVTDVNMTNATLATLLPLATTSATESMTPSCFAAIPAETSISTSSLTSSLLCTSAMRRATAEETEKTTPKTMCKEQEKATRPFHIDELLVTELNWGSSPPFIEIVDFGSALDYDPATASRKETADEKRSLELENQMQSELNWSSEETDRVAEWCGSDGLFIRFHVTYGGDMYLSLSVSVTYDIKFGSITLPVTLPMRASITGLDLDCFVCVNLYRNLCTVWLENTETSTSPINRLNISATFGDNNYKSRVHQRERMNERNKNNKRNTTNAKETPHLKEHSASTVKTAASNTSNERNGLYNNINHKEEDGVIDVNNSRGINVAPNNYTLDKQRCEYGNVNSHFLNNTSGSTRSEVTQSEYDFVDSEDIDITSSSYISDTEEKYYYESKGDSLHSNDEYSGSEYSSTSNSSISSSSGNDDKTNDYDAVFTDEKVITQFILDELRALLNELLIAPNFWTIPISSAK